MAIILLSMVVPPQTNFWDYHWEFVFVLLSSIIPCDWLSLWNLPVHLLCVFPIRIRSEVGNCKWISGIQRRPLRICGNAALIGNPTKLFIPLESPSMHIKLLWLLLLWSGMANQWCDQSEQSHIMNMDTRFFSPIWAYYKISTTLALSPAEG